MSNTNLQTWIGLDSYDEQNSGIFYGRSKEIKEIISSINYNTQTIIYGPSGIGKSSIIKAGVFPKARDNNFLPIYIRLIHNDKTSYTEQIIQTTKEELKKHNADIEKVLRITENDEQSIWEFFQSNVFWSKDNFPLTPMIVIDQFEEIFTLARNKKTVDSFFEELFDLVNNYIPRYVRKYISEKQAYKKFSDEINYKLIVILREDFLGKLEDYDKKYPSLKKNRYSLQAINEEQAKDIILKPGGDLVDIEVAKEIIKKITDEADFEFDEIPEITVEPALLSLFCTELDEKRASEKKSKITVQLIEDFGDDIIKEFYEREISKVSEKTIEFLENKILTSGGFRDSVAVEDALQYGILEEELKTLEENRIIRISERDGLRRIEYTHDILCKVAQENRENRKINQENLKSKKRGRIKTLTISLLLFFIIVGSITVYFSNYHTYVKYSSKLVKNGGFWTGFDDLSMSAASHKTFYYKLSKIGYGGPYTLMEAYDGYGNLTTDHNISTLLLNQWDDDDLEAEKEATEKVKTVCKWQFVKGKNNEILREDAFDKNDSLIFSFTYSQKIDAGDKSFVYGRFTDSKQLPFKQREKGISNIRITYDSTGNALLYEYFDNEGKPAKNSWNAYGEEREYYKNGLLKKHSSLDEFGEYMIDRAENTGMIYDYNEQGNIIRSTSFDTKGNVKNVKDGYAIVEYEYDTYGNMTKVLYFDENNQPCKAFNLIYGSLSKFNDKGKIIETRYLDKDGTSVIKSEETYSKIIKEYDDAGNTTNETYWDATDNYYNYAGVAKYLSTYSDDKLTERKKYRYDKEADTLQLTYHYKTWLNNKKQKTLSFWYDHDYEYINYFETATFGENGDRKSMATYSYPGEYHELNLENTNIWETIENKLV
ncbi:MAG: hypothetical protein HKN31_13755, partial [Pricia sp.]|nr:hypothetical protein [Pricia sp.]